jgi:flagellar protein FlbC
LLPVQMPLNKVDSSFNSNESKPIKSVDSSAEKEEKSFNKIFETVKSDRKKSNNIDIEKKSEPKIIEGNSSLAGKRRLKKKVLQLAQNNEKLISLKKTKFSGTEIRNEKTEAIDIISKKGNEDSDDLNPVELISPSIVQGEQDTNDESLFVNSEIKFELADKGTISNSNQNVAESLNAGTLRELIKSPLITNSKNEKSSVESKKVFGNKRSSVKKANLSVIDLRSSEAGKTKNISPLLEKTIQPQHFDQPDKVLTDNTEEGKPIVVELTHVKDNFSGESKTLTTSSGSVLMKQLEENINNKIVKQSSLVLKDSGSGEIKLILKPEQLGNVRIKLNMSDNRISGQILVDNAAVKEMFEQNLHNLEKTFRENGFDTAALNVSVGGDRSGSGRRENNSDISKQIELIEEIIPTMVTESENLVDLVV